MRIPKIIIGTRGSKLALIQTEIIKEQLLKLIPEAIIEVSIIKTAGDKNLKPIPLDTIGKGWFTKEIDNALINGTIDIAVHSLKDLEDNLPSGLVIASIPKREDPREVLISIDNLQLENLKSGAVVGTDSIRRKVQILSKRKDINVKSIRGNVNRRLEKLDDGEYDAVILAAAGLIRLGFKDKITQYFSFNDFLPSPGQGALAVVARKNNTSLISVLKQMTHEETFKQITAERSFSHTFGGGCNIPVGAYAETKGSMLKLYGMLGSIDNKIIIKDSLTMPSRNYKSIGKILADKMLSVKGK